MSPNRQRSDAHAPLGLRQLLGFYLPLVLTSQMMTLSVPLINLALTRSTQTQLHLAAYGVCFGIAVFLNAPMLVTRDVGAAMALDRVRWRRLTRLTLVSGVLVSGVDLLLAWTPLGDWVFGTVLGATPRVVAEARVAAIALSPIPLLVGLRGLYSALALRAQKTRLLTQATFGRLLVMAAVLWWMVQNSDPTAAKIGWSLSLGIGVETWWIAWVTRPMRRELPESTDEGRGFDLRRMVRFSSPLIVSAYAWTALRPLINGILGRTADSEAAQASFSVLHPLILLTASALWALQATHQILATTDERARKTFEFGLTMTVVFTALVAVLGWVPALRDALLTRVFTLPAELLFFVEPAMRGLFVAPFMLGLRACFKGLILASGRTGVISASAVADLAIVAVCGVLALWLWPGLNGAVLGVALVTVAEIVESTFLGVTAARRFSLRRNRPARN